MPMIDLPTFDGGRTAYQVLGVDETATVDELRTVWKQQIRTLHPDAVRANGGTVEQVQAAEREAACVNAAYRMLSDPDQRADYDRLLHAPPPEPAVDLDEGWGEVDDVIVDEPDPTVPSGDNDGGWFDTGDDDWSAVTDPTPNRPTVPKPDKIVITRGHTFSLIVHLIVLIVLTIAWLVYPHASGSLAWACLGTMFVGTAVFVFLTRRLWLWWRPNRTVLRYRLLEPQAVYGDLPPDPIAGMLDQQVCAAATQLPAAIVVRNPSGSAPFTHAIVCNNQVVLLRGLVVAAGRSYHFQQQALVSEGTYQWENVGWLEWLSTRAAAKSLRLPRTRMVVGLWPNGDAPISVLNDGTSPDLVPGPDVSGLLVGLLSETKPRINQQTVCDTVRLLHTMPTVG